MLLCYFLRAEESKNMARLCLAKIKKAGARTISRLLFWGGLGEFSISSRPYD